jgi:hypothetical protein
MKYLVLYVAGFIQTTIHVTIDDVFQKCTRYFHVFDQQSIMSGKLEKNNRSWKGPQRNSSN